MKEEVKGENQNGARPLLPAGGGFHSSEIGQKFRNVRRLGKHLIYDRYIVTGETGDIAEILTYESEINILIDNFPGQKLHYKYDFPIQNAREFYLDMFRLGLHLEWKHTLCDVCGKIKDCHGDSICDSCDAAELN